MTDWKIHEGDVLDRMREMPDNHFDALLCDAPYGLSDSKADVSQILMSWLQGDDYDAKGRGFMGREWDAIVPQPNVWREALRVLKPGAHLLCFGGTRTVHLLTLSLQLAGFEIRDRLQFFWAYGTGFPKAHDISKGIDKAAGAERELVGTKYEGNGNGSVDAIYGDYSAGHDGVPVTTPATDDARRFDGYKSAIKPSYEPIVCAMAPLDGTYAENALEHGVAGLNVDGGRIGTEEVRTSPRSSDQHEDGRTIGGAWAGEVDTSAREGRYPANLILDEHAARMLDEQSGELKPSGNTGVSASKPDGVCYGDYGASDCGARYNHGDTGGASRFFYQTRDLTRFRYEAKASRDEREAGLLDVEPDTTDDGRDTPNDTPYQRGKTKRANTHPTVKPVDLIRYLATLILPPERDTPRRLLTPYSGSGSEMIGAMLAGWDDLTGIELQRKHIDVAQKRIAWWHEHGEDAIDADKAERKRREQNEETGQVDLIDALQETT